jgi:hypothetical protein
MVEKHEITNIGTPLDVTVGQYQTQLASYLDSLGLPKDELLAEVKDRSMVIQNIPAIIESIPLQKRDKSTYISKFIAACGAGLFDAAINFVWNETIESLKAKIALLDLEYFKSSIQDEDKKTKIKSIDDIVNIDDWDIVRGCKLTGIISDIGYKHLDYIREMRNWASAAHPNHVKISGLQLSAYLETCIKEVISKEPSLPAIEAKQLLKNIRENNLSTADISPIVDGIKKSPSEIIISIFRTMFGMFCDPNGKVETKNNIRLIAKEIWAALPEQQRMEAGIKYANWRANADIPRCNLSREFLDSVNALSYLPESTLVYEIDNALELLQTAHFGYNNFYNEPPYARLLLKYIPQNGVIPMQVVSKYVKTITLCLIGNGHGVSIAGMDIYSELFNRFTDNEIKPFLKLFSDIDFSNRMQKKLCVERYRSFCNILKERTANENIKAVILYINSQTDEQLSSLGNASEYKRFIKSLD